MTQIHTHSLEQQDLKVQAITKPEQRKNSQYQQTINQNPKSLMSSGKVANHKDTELGRVNRKGNTVHEAVKDDTNYHATNVRFNHQKNIDLQNKFTNIELEKQSLEKLANSLDESRNIHAIKRNLDQLKSNTSDQEFAQRIEQSISNLSTKEDSNTEKSTDTFFWGIGANGNGNGPDHSGNNKNNGNGGKNNGNKGNSGNKGNGNTGVGENNSGTGNGEGNNSVGGNNNGTGNGGNNNGTGNGTCSNELDDVLGPIYDRINELENKLKDLSEQLSHGWKNKNNIDIRQNITVIFNGFYYNPWPFWAAMTQYEQKSNLINKLLG